MKTFTFFIFLISYKISVVTSVDTFCSTDGLLKLEENKKELVNELEILIEELKDEIESLER